VKRLVLVVLLLLQLPLLPVLVIALVKVAISVLLAASQVFVLVRI
jgi:hypothetical protein